jgi:hypothetical protein
MLNKHELIDIGTIRLSALLLGEVKFFARSVSAPPLVDVARETDATVEDISRAGRHDITVQTPVGAFEAAYLPWQWLGPEYPTLVYHHGSGERPFNFGRFSANSFRRLFVSTNVEFPVNLIAVRAPFHAGSSMDFARAMGELENFVGMIAAATGLVDALTTSLKDRTDQPVILAGTSLGGWVTNLHRACFDTADCYVPLLAGAALGEMFVSSVYRYMTAEKARRQPAHLHSVLGFEDEFTAVDVSDCVPLLGRYDRIIEYDRQRPSYAGLSISVLEKGHVTGALATAELREHIVSSL